MSNDLGRIIKQQRVMRGLTLQQLSAMSGVSPAHLGRIEKGERFPSARILQKIAKPLSFEQSELFTIAGYLLSEPPTVESEAHTGRIDPHVARVLSEEPVDMQRAVIAILSVLKAISQAHSKVASDCPELTMIDDILEHLQGKGRVKSQLLKCPVCGKEVRARGLLGHLRLAHDSSTRR